MSEAVDVVTALSVRATESKSCIDSKTPPLGKKGSYAKDLNHLEEPCCIRPKNMGWVQSADLRKLVVYDPNIWGGFRSQVCFLLDTLVVYDPNTWGGFRSGKSGDHPVRLYTTQEYGVGSGSLFQNNERRWLYTTRIYGSS